MKISKLLLLSSLIALNIQPTFAASEDSKPMDVIGTAAAMPGRILGVASGMVLGCPIAVLRYSGKDYVDYTSASADKIASGIGGKDNGPVCAVTSIATLPAGIVVGSLQGLFYGSKNAVMHGFNEPFGKDSFTLGSLEDK